MLTAAIVIGLAIAMMVGPIMMIQPSKSQRVLSQLREKAQMGDLKIRMVTNIQTKGAQFIAAYILPLNLPKKAIQPIRIKLERKDYEHGMHFDGQWSLEEQMHLEPLLANNLKQLIKKLPHTIIGIGIMRDEVNVLWTERKRKGVELNDDLALLTNFLKELKAQVLGAGVIKEK